MLGTLTGDNEQRKAGISLRWPLLQMDRTPEKPYPFLAYSQKEGTATAPYLGHLAATTTSCYTSCPGKWSNSPKPRLPDLCAHLIYVPVGEQNLSLSV